MNDFEQEQRERLRSQSIAASTSAVAHMAEATAVIGKQLTLHFLRQVWADAREQDKSLFAASLLGWASRFPKEWEAGAMLRDVFQGMSERLLELATPAVVQQFADAVIEAATQELRECNARSWDRDSVVRSALRDVVDKYKHEIVPRAEQEDAIEAIGGDVG